jgi:hypothetical protein
MRVLLAIPVVIVLTAAVATAQTAAEVKELPRIYEAKIQGGLGRPEPVVKRTYKPRSHGDTEFSWNFLRVSLSLWPVRASATHCHARFGQGRFSMLAARARV